MRRVLLYWREGTPINLYSFISRIKEGYKIPKDTKGSVFTEWYILNEDIDDSLHELEIFIPLNGQRLVENGKDLGQFIIKQQTNGETRDN